jgi:hypothetical protein
MFAMKVLAVFVPSKEKRLNQQYYNKSYILTLVLERTLLDGSNESDNRGEVTLSVGVPG